MSVSKDISNKKIKKIIFNIIKNNFLIFVLLLLIICIAIIYSPFFSFIILFSSFLAFCVLFKLEEREIFFNELSQEFNLEKRLSSEIFKNDNDLIFFNKGYDKKIDYSFTGQFDGHKFSYLFYSFSEDAFKKQNQPSTKFFFNVLVFELPEMNFPHLLFLANVPYLEKIVLEKKFVKISISVAKNLKYSIFTEPDHEIESMQIFDEEFLKVIKNNNLGINLEIKNHQIIIFLSGFHFNKKTFLSFKNILDHLLTRKEMFYRLKDDFLVLRDLKK